MEINRADVVHEVRSAFARYEAALIANDIDTLNNFFWNSPLATRYGVAEELYGDDAIARYRATALPVHPQRRLHNTVITTFDDASATVCTEFSDPVRRLRGRQTQTWVRFVSGWKIVAAHVSERSVSE